MKIERAKENFADNWIDNIMRLFNVLPNFAFTISKTMADYYLYTLYIRVASRVAKWLFVEDLRGLGKTWYEQKV